MTGIECVRVFATSDDIRQDREDYTLPIGNNTCVTR